MTCAQSKARRREARIDPRYSKQRGRDVSVRAARLRMQLQKMKDMMARKGASGKK